MSMDMNFIKHWVLKPHQKIITCTEHCIFKKDPGDTIFDNRYFTLKRKASRSSEPNLRSYCNESMKFFRCYANKAYKSDGDDKEDSTLENNFMDCNCHNCMTLPSTCECKVCLGPFQGREIKSCVTCGNLVCSECVKKIKFCAFCRSDRPFQRNRAVERIFSALALPCKNMRNGCNVVLYDNDRENHELKCSYSKILCPMGSSKKCYWFGFASNVNEHLKSAHDISPFNTSGVIIELNDFWRKMIFAEGKYTVYMNCHQQLFLLNVSFCNGKISMTVSQVNHLTSVANRFDAKIYSIFIKIVTYKKSYSHYQKLCSFNQVNKTTDHIIIDCAALFAKDVEDTAKIDIIIKKADK